jgi:hypothetical protein
MARAAAKRRPPARHHEADKRKHKDSGGQRFEDTLFFNRIRKQAKWVFVLLTIAFAGGFVLFGVGSSNVSGLGDIFSGLGGGSGQPSISKPLKATQQNPKDAKAWRSLAEAYDSRGDYTSAVGAWTTYTTLRPKDTDGLTRLATDYEQQFQTQTEAAQAAQIDAQSAQTTNFGPPPSSLLGRAYAGVPDPIGQAISGAAGQRFNQALNERAATASQLIGVYTQLAKLEPLEASWQFQLAQAAQNAGDTSTAIAAYSAYVKLAPDDANATYARQQIKALGGSGGSTAASSSSSSPQG